jgi:hypothetical protein
MRIACQPRRLALSACVLLAAMLTVAAPARAEDVGHKIIRLCAEGKSLSGYPPSAYAKALKEISPTTEEYSECGQLIRQAQAAAASGHGAAPAAAPLTGAIQATPAEQQAVASAARSGSAPVEVGGQQIHPGVVHANVASAFSTLPTPLLVLLAFLLACLVAFVLGAARKRLRGERTD